jgi:hypothetical protein
MRAPYLGFLVAWTVVTGACSPQTENAGSQVRDATPVVSMAPTAVTPAFPDARTSEPGVDERISASQVPPSLPNWQEPMRPGPGVTAPSGMRCPPLDLGGYTVTHYKLPIVVEVVVDETGRVVSVSNVEGQADFESILETARGCTFETPGTYRGQPVATIGTLTLQPGP